MSSSRAELAWHFDFHTPGSVRVNENPDPKGMARALKSAGIGEIITFAKCHYGYAYYPTRVGTPHPRMRGDALGGALAACRAAGLRVLAYISFGIDGQAGEQHPDWRQLDKDGKGDPPGGYIRVCPFSGYMDGLMLPQIAEVLETYHPNGFWFDTMSALAPCHCAACRESFRLATGKEIPTEENDPLAAVFGRWRHDRGIALVERVSNFIHDRASGMTVGFNQLGSLPYPEPMPKGVTVLTLDPPTYGPQSLQFSLNAAFGAASGRPCEVMPTIFNQGWGDWSLAPEGRFEQVAAAVWARGARLFMGDRLRPEIRLDQRTLRVLKFSKGLRRRIQPAFPDEDAIPSPDTLIVHSPSMSYGDNFERFAVGDTRARLDRLSGAHRLFLDSGANFTVAAECHLSQWLDRVGLVVLPELASIASDTEDRLRRYVENGGRLLVVGVIPKVNGRSLDWAGVRVQPQPWQDHIYLPAGSRTPGDFHVLVRGDFFKVELQGAVCVKKAIAAYDAQHGVRYGWGIGPANDQPSPHPAVTRCRLGDGEVWFLAAPIFSDYIRHGNWPQVRWWTRFLREIHRPRRAWLDSPHGNVELVVWENSGSTWAILIQHGGEQLFGGAHPWARNVGPIPRTDVVLHLKRPGRRPLRARSSPDDKRLSWKKKSDTLVIPAHLNSLWQVIRVDWT